MKLVALAFILIVGSHAQISLGSSTNDRITSTHNKMRMYMAQGAYYIQFLWDSSLATSAQTYADTCPTGPSGGSGYGENMRFVWTNSPVSPLDGYALDAPVEWEQEFSNFGLSSLTMDSTILASGVADATQMAWAKTKYVGCGVTNCGPDPSQSNKSRIVVVCRYSPQGNIIGDDMYEAGFPCANCPSGYACESMFGIPTRLCI